MDQRLQDPAGAVPPDWRGLCEELLRELECWRPLTEVPDCLARARAALAAEAVGEGPTDEELLKLARAELNNSPNWEEPEYDASNPFPYEAPGVAWLNFARAVLARFGHQPAPPVEGEVGELIQWLRSRAGIPASPDFPAVAARLTRAADLLEQRHPAPVPVAEEVAELVASLREEADACFQLKSRRFNEWASRLTRAADLLERQAAPVPVASDTLYEFSV